MSVKASSQVSMLDITDAYSVTLTSEAFAFVGNTSGAPSGLSCATQVIAYCGTQRCSKVTIGTVSCPSGISASISNNGSNAPTITFTTTATITAACEATIPVTVDGVTINKKFSFAVAKTGATGPQGPTGAAGKDGVNGTNLWVNPLFEAGKPQITLIDTSIKAPNGANVNLINRRDHCNTSTEFPVFPGHAYRIILNRKRKSGTLQLKAGIWYTSQVSGNVWDSYVLASSTKTLTDGWEEATYDFTCPNGKSKGCVYLQLEQDFSGGDTEWYVSNIVCSDITGLQGAKGDTGNGVSSSTVDYQVSSSGTTIPTGTWQPSVPSVSPGQYLWTRTILKYTNGSSSSASYSVGRMGTNGTNGSNGRGIKSTVVTYQAGSSGTSAPTGIWTSSVPATSASAPYLWSKTVITYTDNNAPSTTYSVGSTPEGIVVGGRNLYLNSKNFFGGSYSGCISSTTFKGFGNDESVPSKQFALYSINALNAINGSTGGIYFVYNNTISNLNRLKKDETYTISFWIKSSVECELAYASIAELQTAVSQYPSNWIVKTEWQKFEKTFKYTDNRFFTNCFYATKICDLYISSPKLELGNKATDWTPAPEDTEAEISDLATRVANAETSIIKSNEAIELRATKTEVAQTYATKTDVNNIQVGGRNLLPIKIWENGHWLGNSTDSTFKRTNITFPAGTYTFTKYKDISEYADSNSSFVFIKYNSETNTGDSGAVIASSNFYAGTDTFNTTYPFRIYIQFNITLERLNLILKSVKLEKGNKATDWTPAPEDLETRITTAESSIKQTADKISLVVKSGDSESNMVLTDKVCELVANNINLKGRITISGLNSDTQNKINNGNAANNTIDTWCYNNDRTYINGGKIAAGTITANQIAAGTITANQIATGTITKKYRFNSPGGLEKWVWLGTLVSSGDSSICTIVVKGGSGFNGFPEQNSKLEIFIKDGWQSSASASGAFGVSLIPTNWPTNSGNYIRVMASSHNKCDVWVYMPWGYWDGMYEISGMYDGWTHSGTNSSDIPTSGTLQSVNEFPNADALDSQIGAWCYNNDRTYINGGKIYTGSVTADQIAANAITADKISAGAITADKIAAGAITADKLAANVITADKLAADAITGKNITGGRIDINGKFKVDTSGNVSMGGDITLKGLTIGTDYDWSYIDANAKGLCIRHAGAKAENNIRIGRDYVSIDSLSLSDSLSSQIKLSPFGITIDGVGITIDGGTTVNDFLTSSGATNLNATATTHDIIPVSNATYALGEAGNKGWSNIYIGNASSTYNGLRIINGTTNYNLCGINSSNTMIFGDASWTPYIYVKNTSTPSSGAVQSFTIGDNGSTTINDAHVWLYGRNDTTSRYIGSYLVYTRTYGSAANVVVTANGVLGRSTSSSKRYKHDIREFSVDEISCLYDLPLKKFKYNNDYISKDDEYYDKDLYGFIVEDLDEVLPISVQHNLDDDAEYTIPEMWNNNIIVPCLLKLIQDLNNRLKKVEEGKEN